MTNVGSLQADWRVWKTSLTCICFTADSHLSWKYFSEITSMHLAYPDTAATTLYSSPIIFDRNVHLVPGIVRVADVLWSAAGLSGHYHGSAICPPTSAYFVPLELADRVRGWDTGPEAIAEDLHLYLKCFLALNGHLTTRMVTSPVSQTNTTASGGEGLVAYFQGQALRHMWGSLDSSYALKQAIKVWQRRPQKQQLCRPLHHTTNLDTQDYTSFDWQKNVPEVDELAVRVKVFPPNWPNILLLFHRLFEAHFLPAHISILIITSTIYRRLFPENQDCSSIAWTFIATDVLRTVGLVAFLIYVYPYQKHHHLAVEARRSEMIAAGLAGGMADSFSTRSWKNVFDYVWIPFVAPLYGSVPAIHAQLSHFWTLDLTYVVSSKPVRSMCKRT